MKKIYRVLVPFLIAVIFLIDGAAVFANTTFSDVSEDHKAYVPVSYLANKGCVNGRTEDLFAPDAVITRVEVFKLLVACLELDERTSEGEFTLNKGDVLTIGDEEYVMGDDNIPITYLKHVVLPTPEDDPLMDFSDVDFEMWYVPYLQEALHLGLVKGNDDGTVKPLEQVSLAELLTLALRVKKMDAPDYNVDLSILPNYIDTKAWFANGIAFGLQENLISIVEDKQLAPFYKLNRAEAVILVYNYIVSIDDETTPSEAIEVIDTVIDAVEEDTTVTTDDTQPFSEEGVASYYGSSFDGANTASGERLDISALQAAHPTLPFNTLIKITNLDDGEDNPRWVEARVIDRGPYVEGRVVDLTPAAFEALENLSAGLVRVRVEVISSP